MSSNKFSIGDLVWAKMKGFPAWPARITEPPENLSLARTKKGHQCCFFLVSENYSWIRDDQVFKHSASMVPKSMKKKSEHFRKAVELILQQSAESEVTNTEVLSEDDNEEMEPFSSSSAPKRKISTGKLQKIKKHYQEDSDVSEKSSLERGSRTEIPSTSKGVGKNTKSPTNMRERRSFNRKETEASDKDDAQDYEEDDNEEMEPFRSSSAPKRKISTGKLQKIKKHYQEDSDVSEKSSLERGSRTEIPSTSKGVGKNTKSPTNMRERRSFNRKETEASDKDDAQDSLPSSGKDFSSIASSRFSEDAPFPRILNFHSKSVPKVPDYVELPPTSEFDMSSYIEEIKNRNIDPVPKKFGFLGLGFMGRILAKRILHSGHHLMVWNRSPEKCEEFVEAGAHRGQTPADVVAASDITFCCLSDAKATRSIVFDNCGVLSGMDTCGKAFCVLNTIAPSDSVDINKAILDKGGFYLEAFIQGTRSMAKDGVLVVVAAGNADVFDDSTSCFHSFSNNAYLVGYEVGKAATMNILLHALNSGIRSALASTVDFIKKNDGSIPEFLAHLHKSRLNNPELCKNALAMHRENFATEVSVKLAEQTLETADDQAATLYVTNLVSDQYRRASLLRYFNHDATAVYQALR